MRQQIGKKRGNHRERIIEQTVFGRRAILGLNVSIPPAVSLALINFLLFLSVKASEDACKHELYTPVLRRITI